VFAERKDIDKLVTEFDKGLDVPIPTFPAAVILILSVIPNEPVIKALPVYGNAAPPPPEPVFTVIGKVLPSPFVKVIVFKDTEAVVKAFGVLEAVNAYELDNA